MEKAHGVLMTTLLEMLIIFSINNSPSSHTYNLKNDLLILSERDTFGINGSFDAPEKILILI